MIRATAGQLLVNDALPKELRDHGRVLDKKGLSELMERLAKEFPDRYREVSKRLSDIGRTVATRNGGNSFGLRHIKKTQAGLRAEQQVKAELAKILSDDNLDDKKRNEAIIRAAGKVMDMQQKDVYDEALKSANPLALQVLSGSRGNKMNLSSLLGSDMLYTDQKGEVIPFPVLRSYSQGLTPAEYFAGTYGARQGVTSTKFATRDAGYLSKMLNQVSHRLVVVGDEDEDDEVEDTEFKKSIRGLPADVDDPDNEGALLATDMGGYKRNTVLTPKILHDLQKKGLKRLLVRSPLIGGSSDGGVYARDVGVREKGTLPGRGEYVGLTAAQSLSEPLSQSMLSQKHTGGVAGQGKTLGGFKYIDAQIQVPKTMPDGATHADIDGTVQAIREAPAGGNYITVDGKDHYVPPGINVKVKRGDQVEAGDVLTDGLPNHATIVKHKGIGEGRRYFVQAFRQTMKDSGLKANRRNVELLGRGLINHVRMTEEYEDSSPDDVVPYAWLEKTYRPREGYEKLPAKSAVGKYLERPVLHYSIGTKVRPSMLKDLEEFGAANELVVHKDPAPFQPEMIRGIASVRNDPDWLTRMYGSGLKAGFLDSVHHAGSSNLSGTSFVHSLSEGVNFGRQGKTSKPIPGTPKPPEGVPVVEDASKMVKLSAFADMLIEEFIKEATSSAVPPPPKPPAGTSSAASIAMDSGAKATAKINQSQPIAPPAPIKAPPNPFASGSAGKSNVLNNTDLTNQFAAGNTAALDPSSFAALMGHKPQPAPATNYYPNASNYGYQAPQTGGYGYAQTRQPMQPQQPQMQQTQQAATPQAPKSPARPTPNYVNAAKSTTYGWTEGTPEFDNARAEIAKAQNVDVSQVDPKTVQDTLYRQQKVDRSLSVLGYRPYMEKFEAIRNELKQQAGDTPVTDDMVRQEVYARNLADPDSVDDADMHTRLRRDNESLGMSAARMLSDPLGEASFNLMKNTARLTANTTLNGVRGTFNAFAPSSAVPTPPVTPVTPPTPATAMPRAVPTAPAAPNAPAAPTAPTAPARPTPGAPARTVPSAPAAAPAAPVAPAPVPAGAPGAPASRSIWGRTKDMASMLGQSRPVSALKNTVGFLNNATPWLYAGLQAYDALDTSKEEAADRHRAKREGTLKMDIPLGPANLIPESIMPQALIDLKNKTKDVPVDNLGMHALDNVANAGIYLRDVAEGTADSARTIQQENRKAYQTAEKGVRLYTDGIARLEEKAKTTPLNNVETAQLENYRKALEETTKDRDLRANATINPLSENFAPLQAMQNLLFGDPTKPANANARTRGNAPVLQHKAPPPIPANLQGQRGIYWTGSGWASADGKRRFAPNGSVINPTGKR